MHSRFTRFKDAIRKSAGQVWRNRGPVLIFLALLVTSFVGFRIWQLCTSPDGRYDASGFVIPGHNYYEFGSGQAYLVSTDAGKREYLGSYYQRNGTWIFHPSHGGPDGVLIPGFANLRIFDSVGNEHVGGKIHREWAHSADDFKTALADWWQKLLLGP